MWCRVCQQDVPGVASRSQSGICCARCRASLGGPPATIEVEELAEEAAAAEGPLEAQPPSWRADLAHANEDLQAARRLVEALGPYRSPPADDASPRNAAVSTVADQPPRAGGRGDGTRGPRSTSSAATATVQRQSGFLSWVATSLGLVGFAFGAVLLGWSLATSRGDLWLIGLPVTFISQAVLIVGLLMHLDGLLRSNRDTSETLEHLDDQLRDLRHATSMLTTSHSSPAQSFYAHYAGGASPQMLMADLKGQLDLLAQRLGDESSEVRSSARRRA